MKDRPAPIDRQLAPVDEELLELTTLESAWDMVCQEFHGRYGSPGALARRLFELRAMELLDIVAKAPGDPAPTPDLLEAHALEHGCYADPVRDPRPIWWVLATDAGFRRIADRLSRE